MSFLILVRHGQSFESEKRFTGWILLQKRCTEAVADK